MQLLLLLTLWSQLILSALASTDSSSRDTGMIQYLVYPVTGALPAENTNTEAQLNELCGAANVSPVRHLDDQSTEIFDYWTVAVLQNSDLAERIRNLDGIDRIEQAATPEALTADSEHHKLVRRDVQRYIAIAKTNSDLQETEKFLKSKLQKDSSLLDFRANNKTIGWHGFMLDHEAFLEVKKYEGIEAIEIDGKLVEFRALPHEDRSLNSYDDLEMLGKTTLSRRDGKWERQVNADQALRMDSQYRGADLSTLTDFVHIPEPGKNTLIFVIDRGVQLAVDNPDTQFEFHPPGDNPDDIQVLQSLGSIRLNQDGAVDDAKNANNQFTSHGTAVASKALGSFFGVAKSATLVSVKITPYEGEYAEAFELIRDYLSINPGNEDNSVILLALGSDEKGDYAADKANPVWQNTYLAPMKHLLGLGIPIVCAAGNNVPFQENRKKIDSRPQLFQDSTFPIINVGAADFQGKRLSMSRYNDEPMIYAPGDRVQAQSRDGGALSITPSGTSIAAPQVAGLIATYLSQDSVKKNWDGLRGLQRVEAIKRYLLSDASSWARQDETDTGHPIRMIWNGAKKEDHESAGASGSNKPPASPQPPPAPTKAVSIIYQEVVTEAMNSYQWLFFQTDVGKSSLCKDEKDAVKAFETKTGFNKDGTSPWPVGTFAVKLFGTDCEYKNDGKDNAGMLWCGKDSTGIPCHADQLRYNKKPKECGGWNSETKQYAVVFCEW